MSEKHIQGRMVARAWTSHAKTTIGFEESDGNFMAIADVCDFGRLSEHDEQDARRLVACWNLCETVPTENIEELSAFGLFRVLAQTELYKMQRDELVAICQSVLDRGIGASDLAAMRSAIAKVKGGAA